LTAFFFFIGFIIENQVPLSAFFVLHIQDVMDNWFDINNDILYKYIMYLDIEAEELDKAAREMEAMLTLRQLPEESDSIYQRRLRRLSYSIRDNLLKPVPKTVLALMIIEEAIRFRSENEATVINDYASHRFVWILNECAKKKCFDWKIFLHLTALANSWPVVSKKEQEFFSRVILHRSPVFHNLPNAKKTTWNPVLLDVGEQFEPYGARVD
jgi:hypothetical protein